MRVDSICRLNDGCGVGSVGVAHAVEQHQANRNAAARGDIGATFGYGKAGGVAGSTDFAQAAQRKATNRASAECVGIGIAADGDGGRDHAADLHARIGHGY